eukprot:TRINITY_DN95263_c0_g1_i1.p1 TRINITY_DN95263_c0_g1~~TRINITY_DN95263_c0_g1_i1.p1  ORF type:complete len:368 (-),score=58.90 TRINITY_DN95263_c0_g1_i1:49-1152(-)
MNLLVTCWTLFQVTASIADDAGGSSNDVRNIHRDRQETVIDSSGSFSSSSESNVDGDLESAEDAEATEDWFFYSEKGPDKGNATAKEKWVVLYSKGEPYGAKRTPQSLFNEQVQRSRTGILKRECAGCASTHQVIYYKRKKGLSKWNAYWDLLVTWNGNQTLHEDFDLYSSLEEAKEGRAFWKACNETKFQIGFPGDCGPKDLLKDQWNSLNLSKGGQANWRFSVLVETQAHRVPFYVVRHGSRKVTTSTTTIDGRKRIPVRTFGKNPLFDPTAKTKTAKKKDEVHYVDGSPTMKRSFGAPYSPNLDAKPNPPKNLQDRKGEPIIEAAPRAHKTPDKTRYPNYHLQPVHDGDRSHLKREARGPAHLR